MDDSSTTDRVSPWALAAEWLLAMAILAPLALMPLARDQGHFAYAGQVILDGGLPYRDVFDQKGPATHYTYAAVLALFGQTPFGVRMFFLIVALLGARLAAALAERLAGRGARLPCVLCFSLAMLQGDEGTPWHTAQVEDLILLGQLLVPRLIPSEASLWSRWRQFMVGLVLGLSCTYKPTAIVPAAALAAVCAVGMIRSDPRRLASVVARLAWGVAGFLVPPLLAIGFLAMRGALDDFWSVIVEFNATYAGRKNGVGKAVTMLAGHWGRLVVLASFGALAARRRQAAFLDTLLWTLIVSNWAAVIWQGKYWPYHWTPMIGLLAIFASVSVSHVAVNVARRAGRLQPPWRGTVKAVIPAVVAFALALLAVPIDARHALSIWRDAALVAAGRMTLDEFRAPYECGAVRADVHREVAEYVQARTRADDKLLVWGYETVVNFLADRRAPTRFAVDRILCLDEFPRRAAWRREFLASLRSTPPAYILVVDDDGTAMWRDSNIELARFEEFHELVREEYVEEARIDRFHIYRRRGDGGPLVARRKAEHGSRPPTSSLPGRGRVVTLCP
ncbi:MAG TPA: hypothetical protein VMV69_18600 [Pirellulales bacterium]|nr:hypothetical protein [Pirellulales bacterium]